MDGVRNVLRCGAFRGVLRCVMTPVLGAMTLKNDLLGQMRNEWLHVGNSSRARSAMATFAQRHQDLDLGALSDLYDVVTLLEARSGRNVLERAELVCALLEEARDPALRSARRTGGRGLATAHTIAQLSRQSVRPHRTAHLRPRLRRPFTS